MASALVLIIVFVLDVIAFILAVVAEKHRSTATEQKDTQGNTFCKYTSDGATGMAVASMLLLLAAQILIMVASRCLCCGRGLRPGGSRVCAVILFIISWITFFFAEIFLLAGSAKNVQRTKYVNDQQVSCESLKKGIFGVAAAFIIFTGVLTEFYYFSYSKASSNITPGYPRDTGVRMSTM